MGVANHFSREFVHGRRDVGYQHFADWFDSYIWRDSLMARGKGSGLLPIPGCLRTSDDHRGDWHLDAPRLVALARSFDPRIFIPHRNHLLPQPFTRRLRIAVG